MAKQRKDKNHELVYISMEYGHQYSKELKTHKVWVAIQSAITSLLAEYVNVIEVVRMPDWKHCFKKEGKLDFAFWIDDYKISGEIVVDLERIIVSGFCPHHLTSKAQEQIGRYLNLMFMS